MQLFVVNLLQHLQFSSPSCRSPSTHPTSVVSSSVPGFVCSGCQRLTDVPGSAPGPGTSEHIPQVLSITGTKGNQAFPSPSHRFLFHPHTFPCEPLSNPCFIPSALLLSEAFSICLPPIPFPCIGNITFFLSQAISLAHKPLVKIKSVKLSTFGCLYSGRDVPEALSANRGMP